MTATRNFEIQEDGHLCWHSQNGDRCQLKFEFEFEGSNETLIARTRRKDADLLLGAVLILKDTDSNRILVCKKAISQGYGSESDVFPGGLVRVSSDATQTTLNSMIVKKSLLGRVEAECGLNVDPTDLESFGQPTIVFDAKGRSVLIVSYIAELSLPDHEQRTKSKDKTIFNVLWLNAQEIRLDHFAPANRLICFEFLKTIVKDISVPTSVREAARACSAAANHFELNSFFSFQRIVPRQSVLEDVWARAIVVQTENHQAAQVGGKKFFAEPFVSKSAKSLSRLEALGLPVEQLQEQCSKTYEAWSSTRLRCILNNIGKQIVDEQKQESKTSQKCKVTFVVFPEFSVLQSQLAIVRDFAQAISARVDPTEHALVIVAGTHTIGTESYGAIESYRDLGFSEKSIEAMRSVNLQTKSAAAVFISDQPSREVRGVLVPKRILSPFELTNTESHVAFESTRQSSIESVCIGDRSLQLNLFICAEALQMRVDIDSAKFDLAIITAYSSPAPFEGILRQLKDNRRLTIFANDGLMGGSGVFIPETRRGDSWWFDKPHNGTLPAGDGVLIAEFSLRNLADVFQVSNPSERCRLKRLSAVVPKNISEPSYLVAEALGALRRAAANNPDKAMRDRVLNDCIECPGITALQHRKLRRLLSLDRISDNVWDFFGNDIVIDLESSGYEFDTRRTRTDETSNVVSFRTNTEDDYKEVTERAAEEAFDDLRENLAVPETPIQQRAPAEMTRISDFMSFVAMEVGLLNSCIETCRSLANSEVRDAMQHEALQLSIAEMKERLRSLKKTSHDRTTNPIIDHYWAFVREVSSSSLRLADQDVNRLTGEIAEAFQASYAFLFILVPTVHLPQNVYKIPVSESQQLINICAHHSTIPRRNSLHGSMAGKCATSLEPQVYPVVRQNPIGADVEDFDNICKETKSAVAVPLFQGSNKESLGLLGVLVLESTEAGKFDCASIGELQGLASELKVPMQYLIRRNKYPLVPIHWYPPLYEGDFRKLLSLLLDSIVGGLAPYAGPGLIAAAIWELDSINSHAYAIAAKGYDSEYMRSKLLRLSNGENPRSFVGNLLCDKTNTFKSDEWRNIGVFRKRKKAERHRLHKVFGKGFDGPSLSHQQLGSGASSLSLKQDSTRNAIVFYTFHNTRERVADVLREGPIKRLTALMETMFQACSESLVEYATQKSYCELTQYCSGPEIGFRLVEKRLMNTLNCDGCTILGLQNDSATAQGSESALYVRSTTGLANFTEEAPRSSPTIYRLDDEGRDSVDVIKKGKGLYPFIRFNVRQDSVRSDNLKVRYEESYVLSENDHRKSLFIGITGSQITSPKLNGHVGVVRLVRNSRSLHFDSLDIFVARTIATMLSNLEPLHFVSTLLRNDESLSHDLERHIGQIRRAFNTMEIEYLSGREDQATKALRRLVFPTVAFSSWSRGRVSEVLRDLFVCCDRKRSTLSMLRIARNSPNALAALDVRFFHSFSDFELSEEAAGEAITESEGGIGWSAVMRSQLLVAEEKKAESYTTMFPQAQQCSSIAMCLPVRMLFGQSLFQTALSCEWANDDHPDKWDLAALILAACKLSWLANGGGHFSPERVQSTADRMSTEVWSFADRRRQFLDQVIVAAERHFLPRSNQGYVLGGTWYDGSSESRIDFSQNSEALVNQLFHWRDTVLQARKEFNVPDLADPLRDLGQFVDRKALDPKLSESTDSPRQFGRIVSDLFRKLESLSNSGGLVDFKRRRLCIPLTYGGIHFGWIGVQGSPDANSKECFLHQCMSFVAEVQNFWFRCVSEAPYRDQTFSVRVIPSEHSSDEGVYCHDVRYCSVKDSDGCLVSIEEVSK